MTDIWFELKFNLYKQKDIDIADHDYDRISNVFGCAAELVQDQARRFDDHIACLAHSILGGGTDLRDLGENRCKMTIAFMGDSLTSDREGYFNIIKKCFTNYSNYEFIDAAVSGYRTNDTVEYINSRMAGQQPDIVSIMLGTNDINRYGAIAADQIRGMENYAVNMRQIIEKIKENGAEIILNTIPPINRDIGEYVGQYNQCLADLSREYKTAFNDMSSEYEKYPIQDLVIEDNLHLNETSQKMLAIHLLPILHGLITCNKKYIKGKHCGQESC
jgi:lysophospholipase L1-like esterase